MSISLICSNTRRFFFYLFNQNTWKNKYSHTFPQQSGQRPIVLFHSKTNCSRHPQVECPDCLKHYVPPKENSNASEPQICAKCKDRKVERKEAIIELVQTEMNYGNDLQILKEVSFTALDFNPSRLHSITP